MNKYIYALKTIGYLLVFGLFLGNNSAFTQSVVWTGDVDSDWTNSANWQPNEVPTAGYTATVTGNPQGGNFPIYAGDPVIDFTIQNFGTITFNSFIYNEGTIINFNGGQMISNNFFANAGEVLYNNDGQFDNNGIFENFGQFRNTAAATFNNATGAAVNNYGSFTNFGPINNDGFWGNFGAVFSSGSFNNYGTIDNRGSFDNGFGSVFNNEQNATVSNVKGQFMVNGTLRNNGSASINNGAKLLFLTASNVDNQSSINNSSEVSNSSKTFANNGSITNTGEWSNEDASEIANNTTFSNNGTVLHNTCARWIQNSTSTIGGTFLNEGGLVYEINGQVNVSGGEFGYEFSDLTQTAPPVPGCRAGVVVQLDENGQGSLQVDDIDKGAYGNCGAQITARTITPNTFTTADIGSKIVTLFVEDEFGLSSTCDATVQVLEFVPPIVAVDDPDIDLDCPTDIVLQTAPGADFVAVDWTEPTGTSNCNTGGSGGDDPVCPGLVQNAGFEDGLTGYGNWGNTTIRTDLSDVYSGSKSAKIGSHSGGFYQTINNVEAGVEYTYSAYGERTNDQTEWTGIGIDYYDANWNYISGKSTQVTATSFELYTVKLVAPANVSKAVIYGWKNGDSGRVYLDDLCFYGGGSSNSCGATNIDGFVYMGEFNGSRYYCSQTSSVTYQQAISQAQAAGGHLVTVNNQEENDFLRSNIQFHSAWIGYTNIDNGSNFYWTSGSSSYTNWKAGEPNEASSSNVAARILKDSGQWTDRQLHNQYEFVMEIECGNSGGDDPQVCDLQNHGAANSGQGDRMMWIKFDDQNSPLEYPVQAGAKFTQLDNGTPTLTGRVNEFSGNGGYDFSVRLINKRSWTEWSALGRSFKLGANSVDN
ncbi:MAG: lectin-like protein, partial [Saprospiraceae bacterium]